ncbi:MAG: trypsin-like peptidase domain-containing protein [Pseudomonadota bacterium]
MPRSPMQLYRPSLFTALALLAGAIGTSADCALAQQAQPAPAPPPSWSETLERVSSGVVSIRVDGTRAFDTEWNQSTQATGFVVDAERGLVLTNRHVVMPGPVVAQGVFVNNEEVELVPVYRDPVHDFGFYRYDPAALRYIQPPTLELHPEGAQVGRDVRVIGNDAGEQLSILAGTIAKLDRAAPTYGKNKYNDFNTFYFQAASSTSGGSSGSPVIDIDGRVVALNAGANNNAASSFFLPLDRVHRALRLIQQESKVARGSLLTIFKHKPFDELRRLGLSSGTEASVRAAFPQGTGMLVVDEVLPQGPGDGVLEPGDILVSVDHVLVNRFVPLEERLDASVGEEVSLLIRRGEQDLRVAVTAADLHGVTPASLIEVGGAIVHDLSYQQARHLNVPVRGTYVASPGYLLSVAGIPRGAVITELNGRDASSLGAFEARLAEVPDGQPLRIRYFTEADPRRSTLRVVNMNRAWFPNRACERDDFLGYWPCRALDPGPPAVAPTAASTRFAKVGDPRADYLAPSLVMVNYDMPYTVSGVADLHYHGTGVIVDAQRGLVVVDRNTVPVAMGDVRMTFAGSLEVPAEVVYVHPLHNLTLLHYDPALIGDTPTRAATFSTLRPKAGDRAWVVGLRSDHKIVSQGTIVASVDAAEFPLSRSFRFRDSNLETISVVNAPPVDGVLANDKGAVLATWSSFAYQDGRQVVQVTRGMPIDIVADMVNAVREEQPLRSLEAELWPIPMAAARQLGLPDDYIAWLEGPDGPAIPQVLKVMRLVAGSPAAQLLETGDLLLAVDGKPVANFRDVEGSTTAPQVTLTVLRDGAMRNINVQTVPLSGRGVDRAVVWAGALLQAPHRALAAQRGIEPYGAYVAYFAYGSPASRHGLWAGRRVVEVDGEPIPDLDAFVAAVSGRRDRDSLRLKTVGWNGASDVITLNLDLKYWPAYELRRGPDGWQRQPIDSVAEPGVVAGEMSPTPDTRVRGLK